ncbi:hypothetical protein HWV62_34187 [Athelia sp. TMB]|nr:hypothetical protein HWV62_34187 [Athelia sp. TMB]
MTSLLLKKVLVRFDRFLATLPTFGRKILMANLTTARARIGLPVELWISVFKEETLDQNDIFRIRLCCRAFGILASPMAFRSLTFRPTDNTLDSEANEDQSARLAFWSSDDIAGYMTRCTFHCKIDHPTTLMHIMFFTALPKFINISYLRFEGVQFDDYALDATSRLPRVRTLVLFDCDLRLEVVPPTLSIHHIQFGSNAKPNDARPTRGRYGWTDILCPEAIRELTLKFSIPGRRSLRGIMSESSPQANNSDAIFAAHLKLVMSHPKTLESLTIGSFGRETPPIQPTRFDFSVTLPSLHTYNGINALLRFRCFEPTEKLQSMMLLSEITPPVVLGELDGKGFLHPQSLAFGIHPYPHVVRELGLKMAVLSENLLAKISTEYPNVRVLSIVAERVDQKLYLAATTHVEVSLAT